MQFDLDRFLALVCRELGAKEARVLAAGETTLEVADARELRCLMPDGRAVTARFEEAPADRDIKLRRLEMLAGTFDAVVEEAPRGPRSRPPVGRALQEELQGLTGRAGAVNAVVVDANSPVIWGAALPAGLTFPETPAPAGANDVGPADQAARASIASRAAVDAVRGLSDIAASRKGKHVRHVERNGSAPFVAHSFAGIYLLVLVYDGPFDELRAERTIVEALPRVERLVMALPPLDPSPTAGSSAMAMRRRS